MCMYRGCFFFSLYILNDFFSSIAIAAQFKYLLKSQILQSSSMLPVHVWKHIKLLLKGVFYIPVGVWTSLMLNLSITESVIQNP